MFRYAPISSHAVTIGMVVCTIKRYFIIISMSHTLFPAFSQADYLIRSSLIHFCIGVNSSYANVGTLLSVVVANACPGLKGVECLAW